MIRHFIVEPFAPPRPWNPANPSPELPRDCLYFGKALVEMERHLGPEDLHCYLTWSNEELPEYGAHVIAVLVGEEWGMIPRYARHVRLVARVMGQKPFLGIRKWLPFSRLKFLLAIKHARNWLRHVRSQIRVAFPPSEWPTAVHRKPNICTLPWGSASLVDVPMKPMKKRTQNYFFSGGITKGTDFGFRKWLSSPKIQARQDLVAAVTAMEAKHPELSSSQSVRVHVEQATGALDDNRDYAERLMNARICLAPRGSVADTWRYFEGLKSGCVVVTNPLPDEWYYRDTPAIQIQDWDELESVLLPLLADERRLQSLHEAALTHWQDVCGEQALGRFLARAISERAR